MDILQLIKEEQAQITSLLAGAKSLSAPLRARIERLLRFEGEVLFPEILDLFSTAPTLVAVGTAQHKALKRQLTAADKGKLDLGSLQASFTQHTDFFANSIMPMMRTTMPTQDREDLGQLFMEETSEESTAAAKPARVSLGRR